MSSEPIQKAKNLAKAIKWLSIGFGVALIVYLLWANWKPAPLYVFNKTPNLPMTVWLALFFVAGAATGGIIFRHRKK